LVSARRLVRVAEGVVWLARVPCTECGGFPDRGLRLVVAA
jgi:hypothetical protein